MPVTTFRELCLRAGGRRRYNAERQHVAIWRRIEIQGCLADADLSMNGLQKWLAERFGVSQATICRDLAEMPFGDGCSYATFIKVCRRWARRIFIGRGLPKPPRAHPRGWAIRGKVPPVDWSELGWKPPEMPKAQPTPEQAAAIDAMPFMPNYQEWRESIERETGFFGNYIARNWPDLA